VYYKCVCVPVTFSFNIVSHPIVSYARETDVDVFCVAAGPGRSVSSSRTVWGSLKTDYIGIFFFLRFFLFFFRYRTRAPYRHTRARTHTSYNLHNNNYGNPTSDLAGVVRVSENRRTRIIISVRI